MLNFFYNNVDNNNNNKVNNNYNNNLINENEKRAIYLWQNGLGDMNKFLNGENPLPPKNIKANSNSWRCTPFSNFIKTNCNIILTPEEYRTLSMGHIPEVMEDHWFMYCDDNSVNYFRSWTGIQIFKGYYKFENDSYIIYSLEINNNKEEYKENDINQSLILFNYLILSECKTY